MAKKYKYVGPPEIREKCTGAPEGISIGTRDDIQRWLQATGQHLNSGGAVPLTFVVDEAGILRVADRRSEHVRCAGGGAVRSAGEMFLRFTEHGFVVDEVSNHSTGYCPEPESWNEVGLVLDRIGLHHPGRFTTEVVFRRCPSCGERNVVKESWFVCVICGEKLPTTWNF